MGSKADVMVVAVTQVETKAIIELITSVSDQESIPFTVNDRTYHDLGQVNGAKIVLTISEMGAAGLGGAQESVRKGIEALNPNSVFMVGIAFGMDKYKQAIGDILVSKQLRLYDLQRVGKNEIVLRGDKPHASTRLINYCNGANLYWTGEKVRMGSILTGNKLIDNIDYREQLKKHEPEAIGGEMEGQGLYVSCNDKKIDWILIKAICDWADGRKKNPNKSQNQKVAAKNAASFFLCVLLNSELKNNDLKSSEQETARAKLSISLRRDGPITVRFYIQNISDVDARHVEATFSKNQENEVTVSTKDFNMKFPKNILSAGNSFYVMANPRPISHECKVTLKWMNPDDSISTDVRYLSYQT